MESLPWSVVARAELTKRLAHGDRYLETRLFLLDGRIMEQVNTGVPDLENDWKPVGRYADLGQALRQHRGDGWAIHPPSAPHWRWRIVPAVAVIAAALLFAASAAVTRWWP